MKPNITRFWTVLRLDRDEVRRYNWSFCNVPISFGLIAMYGREMLIAKNVPPQIANIIRRNAPEIFRKAPPQTTILISTEEVKLNQNDPLVKKGRVVVVDISWMQKELKDINHILEVIERTPRQKKMEITECVVNLVKDELDSIKGRREEMRLSDEPPPEFDREAAFIWTLYREVIKLLSLTEEYVGSEINFSHEIDGSVKGKNVRIQIKTVTGNMNLTKEQFIEMVRKLGISVRVE